jgi:Zn finger protein HypA/HybF involved in hydrogenase expression
MSPETVRCWTCSKETETGLDACPHCGAKPYYLADDRETNTPRAAIPAGEQTPVRCWTCSKETKTGLDACPHCGASPYYLADDRETSAPRVSVTDKEVSVQRGWVLIPEHAARLHPKYGVKGWAKFFAVILFFSCVVSVVQLLIVVHDSWGILPDNLLSLGFLISVAVTASWLLICCYGFFVVHRVFHIGRNTARHVLVYLALVPSEVLLVTAYIRIFYPEAMYALSEDLMTELVRTSVISAIWAFYFLESVRTNVTFRHRVRPRDPYLERIGLAANVRRAAMQTAAGR